MSEMYNQADRNDKKDTTGRVDAGEEDEATNLLKRGGKEKEQQ